MQGRTPRVRPVDADVTCAPNSPEATLIAPDRGPAELWLHPHFDDEDQRQLVLSWDFHSAARREYPNDEGINGHPLYQHGLEECPGWAKCSTAHSSPTSSCAERTTNDSTPAAPIRCATGSSSRKNARWIVAESMTVRRASDRPWV